MRYLNVCFVEDCCPTGNRGRIHITNVEDPDAALEGAGNPLGRFKTGDSLHAVVLGPVATKQVRTGA
jgi:hypothetical protein